MRLGKLICGVALLCNAVPALASVVPATPGHLVWSNESGWVYAGDLCVGSTFMTTEHHAATVVDIVLDPTPTKTYNFAVADTGTYFANGLWVHNTSTDCNFPKGTARQRLEATGPPPKWMKNPQDHHRLPQNFREEFEVMGIDIDDPLFNTWVDGSDHQHFSSQYDDYWTAFFLSYEENNLKPTHSEVMGYLATLINELGFP